MANEDRAVVYPTMWRPKLVKGVPRDFLIMMLPVSMLTMMATAFVLHLFGVHSSNVIGLASGFVMFFGSALVGYMMAREDPEFLTVRLARRFRVKRTPESREGNEYSA